MYAYQTYAPGDTIGAWSVVANSNGNSYVTDLLNNNYASPFLGGSYWPTTPSGAQYVYLADSVRDNGIEQAVYLGLGSYKLSYIQADLPGDGSSAPGGALRTDVQGVSSLLGGWVTTSVPTQSPWVQKYLYFNVASAGIYSVRFESVGGKAGLLDDVQLAAVPEPSSIVSMLVGVCFVGTLRRRRSIARD